VILRTCTQVTPVNEYRHEAGGGIARLFPQPGSVAVRCLFQDGRGDLALLNPVNDQVGGRGGWQGGRAFFLCCG
jgi:hypothetical protein